MTSFSNPAPLPEHVDVAIVGAGISGIGAAYRVQTECPDRSYIVLEARESLGGTWDLFRYPGVRSDSDIFTLSYPFRPWTRDTSIADGADILDYLRDTADRFGIGEHLRCGVKVVAAEWNSARSQWQLTVERTTADGSRTRHEMTCAFLYLCTGYYDYEHPHNPEFPGIESFNGTVVHPQFWPSTLDYAGKRVVVIGSGATAITVVPAMAGAAAKVTMLQRTPTWIGALPRHDDFADRMRRLLPATLAHRLIRARNIALSAGFYQYCRRFPDRAKTMLTTAAARRLRNADLVREHFTPPYAPWDQRLCIAADADLFKVIRDGSAEVVTDHIDSFVPEGIRLRSGTVLPADIVVTATGLRLLPFGRIAVSVDGEPVEPARHLVWRGAMLSDIPNFAACIGYINASWTLRADLTARLVCKVLNHMRRHRLDAVTVHAEPGHDRRPLLDMNSGYIQRAVDSFPRQGDRSPWRMRQNYPLDAITTLRTNLGRELRPVPRTAAATVPVAGR